MLVTAQIICDIIKYGLTLSDDQIWIYNQRRAIPEDKRLYVTVGVLAIKPYAVNNRPTYSDALGVMQDTIGSYVQETMSIDLFSYTTEALERYSEVMAAMASTYAQQKMETYNLRIATVPISVNDVSHVEGPAEIYRIAIALPVLRKYDKIMSADYYEHFYSPYVSKTQK